LLVATRGRTERDEQANRKRRCSLVVFMATERNVAIRTESIELAALLKWAQVVHSGGEAKQLIQDGRVRVNGEVERRRGRKVVLGDHVEIDGVIVIVTKADAQRSEP